jgi:hypothetical protein
MGLMIGGQKMGGVYIGGVRHNMMLNGRKIWPSGPSVDPDAIVIEVTVAIDDMSFVLPLCADYLNNIAYAVIIDWGDGTTETASGASNGETTGIAHYYSAPGAYVITVRDADPEQDGIRAPGWGRVFGFYPWNESGPNAQANRDKVTRALNLPGIAFCESETFTGDGFLAGVFYQCSNLAQTCAVTLPPAVTAIGNMFMLNMYFGCASLTSAPDEAPYPPGVTTIGYAFRAVQYSNCSNLTAAAKEADYPQGLSSIDTSFRDGQYSNCSSLTKASPEPLYPAGLSRIESFFRDGQYNSCTALTQAGGEPPYPMSGDGMPYIGSYFRYYQYANCPALRVGNYVFAARFGAVLQLITVSYSSMFNMPNTLNTADTVPLYYTDAAHTQTAPITNMSAPSEGRHLITNRTGIVGYASLDANWK